MSSISKRVFIPSDNYVKVIGRTIMLDDCRLLCTSGSGVEFAYTGSRLKVTFLGDSSTNLSEEGTVNWRDIARVLVIVDGHIMLDTAIKRERESFIVFGEDASLSFGNHVVSIVKLSEARMSSVALGEIEIESEDLPYPTKYKEKFVEFIGDSITCGYGVDTDNELCPFSTVTENATRAYAYMAADEMDVDYSLVAYSGHGFISGWTPDANVPKKEELIQPYYGITAYSYNDFHGVKPQNHRWDFVRIPDVIVINIGTNDFSYTQDNKEKIEGYKSEYIEFLKEVRRINEKSHIICSIGVMGDDLYPAIEQLVEEYKSITGDGNVSTFHFTPQNPEIDGYSSDYHPSLRTQKKAAKEMVTELKKWL